MFGNIDTSISHTAVQRASAKMAAPLPLMEIQVPIEFKMPPPPPDPSETNGDAPVVRKEPD